jgi:hypothetical protein
MLQRVTNHSIHLPFCFCMKLTQLYWAIRMEIIKLLYWNTICDDITLISELIKSALCSIRKVETTEMSAPVLRSIDYWGGLWQATQWISTYVGVPTDGPRVPTQSQLSRENQTWKKMKSRSWAGIFLWTYQGKYSLLRNSKLIQKVITLILFWNQTSSKHTIMASISNISSNRPTDLDNIGQAFWI